jgi:hypothetical protein
LRKKYEPLFFPNVDNAQEELGHVPRHRLDDVELTQSSWSMLQVDRVQAYPYAPRFTPRP